jgi:hypothetical protein
MDYIAKMNSIRTDRRSSPGDGRDRKAHRAFQRGLTHVDGAGQQAKPMEDVGGFLLGGQEGFGDRVKPPDTFPEKLTPLRRAAADLAGEHKGGVFDMLHDPLLGGAKPLHGDIEQRRVLLSERAMGKER